MWCVRPVEGVTIIVAVFIVVGVGSINDWQKEKQSEALNEKREERSVKVVRDGREQLIDVLLEPGDIISCNGVFLSGHNVQCDESSATGKSDAIKKLSYDPHHLPLPPLQPPLLRKHSRILHAPTHSSIHCTRHTYFPPPPSPPRLRRRLRSRSSNGVPMLALAQNTSAYMWRDPQRAHPRQGLRYVACAARYAQQEHCCTERGVVWRERGIGAMGWMGRRGTGGCITLVVLSEKERLSRVAKWDAWMGPRESGRTPVHSRRQVGTLYVQHVCHLQIYTLLTNTQPSYEFITYL